MSYKGIDSRRVLERPTVEGESPVDGIESPPLGMFYQSSTDLVELRVKLGGPPSKAKYSLATDSEEVARANDEKNPY